MSDLTAVWRRISDWHLANLPPTLRDFEPPTHLLRAGASEEQVKVAESTLGLSLPADVRESYCLHDGSENDYAILPWGFHLLSLAKVVEHWSMWRTHAGKRFWEGVVTTPKGPIQPVHWSPNWIPISHNNGGDHQCVDLAPVTGGMVGQVIGFSHEVGPLRVLANSFGEWLQAYAADLDAGRYRYDPDDLWVVPR